MSDQNYRLISKARDVVRFGRLPDQLPIDHLSMCYSELETYYKAFLVPNRDRVDYVIVEEQSLLALVRNDSEAVAAYLSPLINGHIVVGSIGYVVALTGWLVLSFDYIDEHNEEFTVIYFTPVPPGTVMSPNGSTFEQLNYTSVN